MVKTYDLENEMMIRWQEFVGDRFARSRHAANIYWPNIVMSYGEKHRHYHNLSHIKSCLDILEKMARLHGPTYELNVIESAIWFHDIVYDTQAKDNEEKSADYARNVLLGLNVSPLFRAKVIRMIHLTKHSGPSEIPLTTSEKLFLDIDLSILGASPEAFKEYDENIRKEYSWVPEPMYSESRTKIMSSFLNRDFIYQTPDMQIRFENQARKNIKSLLEVSLGA